MFCCRTWEVTAFRAKAQVRVPVKFIVGDLDLTYHVPGVKEYYIHNGGFKKDVPFLEEVVAMKDSAHFINQGRPREINTHIHDFLSKNYELHPILPCCYFLILLIGSLNFLQFELSTCPFFSQKLLIISGNQNPFGLFGLRFYIRLKIKND